MELSYSIITLLLPLFMFFVLGLLGMKMPKQVSGVLGTVAMLVTTVIAYGVALTYFFDPQYTYDVDISYDGTNFCGLDDYAEINMCGCNSDREDWRQDGFDPELTM